eukprot:TRINITY_DN38218_c0_g1_i1.p1 TRINITY_DN38218_c0_g1~~TRINITY_DN38218_c0_g1_i1.p1  ORF type:complete len:618 (+),score=103.50 TRINITY_DN38218_c0_g1_i1:98-1951(+)
MPYPGRLPSYDGACGCKHNGKQPEALSCGLEDSLKYFASPTSSCKHDGVLLGAAIFPMTMMQELKLLNENLVDAHQQQVQQVQKLLAFSRKIYNSKTPLDTVIHADQHMPQGVINLPLSGEGPVKNQNGVRIACSEEVVECSEDPHDDSRPSLTSAVNGVGDGQAPAPAVVVAAARKRSKMLSKSSWADQALSGAKSRKSTADTTLNEMMETINSGLQRSNTGLDNMSRQERFQLFMRDFANHVYCELFCAFIIVINAFWLAFETEQLLTRPVDQAAPAWMAKVGLGFTVFFTLELLMRMSGGLKLFFCTCCMWNYFDFFIVLVSIASAVMQASSTLSNTRMIRLLRLTRMVKVLRMVRIIRVFTALRTLLNSLFGTIKQVIWAFVLIIGLIFVFGVIFGQVVSAARHANAAIMDDEALAQYWGTLPRCMYTLYLSVSGGQSWEILAEPLIRLGAGIFLGFMLYVALIQWVVLNVITGCFCESAAAAARQDVSLSVQAYRSDRDQFLQRCKIIFRAVDQDDSGQIPVSEMKPYLDSEPARALFASLDLDVGDVHGLFDLIDEDGSEAVDLEEFMFGCMRLRGGAKALDIAKVQFEQKKILKVLSRLEENLNTEGVQV